MGDRKNLGKAQKAALAIKMSKRMQYEQKQAKLTQEERKRQERQKMYALATGENQKSHTTHLTQFDGLSKYEIERSKREAQQAVVCDYKHLDVSGGAPFLLPLPQIPPKQVLPIPIKPEYNEGETKADIERKEQFYWNAYSKKMKEIGEDNITYYEHNFLVWKQLWNTLEYSDVVLLIVDIRFPLFHFPHKVYSQLKTMGKPTMLVLTKSDLVSSEVLQNWIDYFTKK